MKWVTFKNGCLVFAVGAVGLWVVSCNYAVGVSYTGARRVEMCVENGTMRVASTSGAGCVTGWAGSFEKYELVHVPRMCYLVQQSKMSLSPLHVEVPTMGVALASLVLLARAWGRKGRVEPEFEPA